MRLRRCLAVLVAVLALACSPSPGTDVILITIDTLRADRVGSYGYDAARTSVLDRLAAEGVRYDQCFSPAPVTLPAHASILTGQLPPRHGVRNNLTYQLPPQIPTLAETLKDAGYQTGAFVGAFPLDARFGLDRGFDHYDDALPGVGASLLDTRHRERPATTVVGSALEWVKQQPSNQSVFVWLHFYEPHAPYAPPADIVAADPYDGEVQAADRAVGEFLRGFDEMRTAARITVVTSDHGEGLGDHDEDTHAFFLYEATQRVPFIVHAPGQLEPAVVSDPVTLCDIAPTIQSLVGLPVTLTVDGAAVLPHPAPAERRLYAETLYGMEGFGWSPMFAMRRGAQKVIRSRVPLAFDLDRDPAELQNLVQEPWAQERLRELDVWVTELNRAVPSSAVRQPTSAEVAALESLGYTGGASAQSGDDELLSATRSRPDASDHIEEYRATTRAQDMVRAGQVDAAIAELTEILNQNPEAVWVHSVLANAYNRTGDLDAALRHYELTAEHNPRRMEPQLNLARIKQQLGDGVGALDHLRRASDLDPQDAPLLGQLVRALTGADRGREALDLLRQRAAASNSDQELARLSSLRARVYVSLGETDQAERAARTAVQMAPTVDAEQVLAVVLRAQGRWSEMLQAVSSEPHDRAGTSLEMRGDAQERLGQPEAAMSSYQAALALDDRQLHATRRLAWLLAARGDAQTALPLAQRGVEMRPDPSSLEVYFEVLEKLGQTDQLTAQLRRAREQFPDDTALEARAERLGI